MNNRAKILVALVGCAVIGAATLGYAAAAWVPEQDVVIATGRAFTKPMSFSHSKHKEFQSASCRLRET
jgi:hypothetical protein